MHGSTTILNGKISRLYIATMCCMYVTLHPTSTHTTFSVQHWYILIKKLLFISTGEKLCTYGREDLVLRLPTKN